MRQRQAKGEAGRIPFLSYIYGVAKAAGLQGLAPRDRILDSRYVFVASILDTIVRHDLGDPATP
jgi:hypothetical protein